MADEKIRDLERRLEEIKAIADSAVDRSIRRGHEIEYLRNEVYQLRSYISRLLLTAPEDNCH